MFDRETHGTMTSQTFDPTEPIAPSATDAVLARESARRLALQLAKVDQKAPPRKNARLAGCLGLN
jgi:hypothetical protein